MSAGAFDWDGRWRDGHRAGNVGKRHAVFARSLDSSPSSDTLERRHDASSNPLEPTARSVEVLHREEIHHTEIWISPAPDVSKHNLYYDQGNNANLPVPGAEAVAYPTVATRQLVETPVDFLLLPETKPGIQDQPRNGSGTISRLLSNYETRRRKDPRHVWSLGWLRGSLSNQRTNAPGIQRLPLAANRQPPALAVLYQALPL